MILQNNIASLKTDITDKIGQKIIVKGALGRSKFFEKEAIIEGAFPNLFKIKYDGESGNTSYTYNDILTRTVEVEVYDGEGGYSPLIPPPVETKKIKNL